MYAHTISLFRRFSFIPQMQQEGIQVDGHTYTYTTAVTIIPFKFMHAGMFQCHPRTNGRGGLL